MTRLPPQPSELIDRRRSVAFTFDGKPATGLEGDTIASALYADGHRAFSHSAKYQRRRGLMCCAGQCANCMVTVGGSAVRACVEPLRAGLQVQSAGHARRLGLNPPRPLWPLYERVRRQPPAATVSNDADAHRSEAPVRTADVLVVGGGVAGMCAAGAAAEQGADVVMVEQWGWLGGRLLWEGAHEQARTLTAQLERAGVEVHLDAEALEHRDGSVLVAHNGVRRRIRAREYIYATGAIEQPLVFAGNDLPGVMLSGGARRLVSLYGVAPGTRAVVVTTSDRGVRAAIALQAAGVPVSVLADLRPEPTRACRRLPANRIELLQGWTVIEARGRRAVRSAVLAPLEGLRSGTAVVRREIECDLLIVSGCDAPVVHLTTQAGGRTRYDEARGYFRLDGLPAGVRAAGQLTGEGGWGVAEVSGELAGLEAVRALGLTNGNTSGRRTRLQGRLAANDRPERAVPPPDSGEGAPERSFTCFCSDVRSKDVRRCARGEDRPLDVCRQTTGVTMGGCWGQMCHLAALRLMARETGQSMDSLVATERVAAP